MMHFVLSGYFGFDNTGDEAILRSMVSSLLKKYPMSEITVLSNNPEKTSKLYGVHAVNRWSFKEVVTAVRGCDCLISGGGSLLQDVTGLKSLGYYLAVIRLAKLVGKPVFFYAQGIGPIETKWGRFLVKMVVNKVDYITVRDRQSEIALQEMGVVRPIIITADPVLNMPTCAGVTPSKVICVSLREWQNGSKFKKAVAEVCDDFCEEGYKVFFIPFQHPKDLEISRATAALMKNKSFIADEPLAVEEIACALAHAEVVIGMRYHALVLAAVNGVPFVGIEYDPKVSNFLKQTGMPSAGNPDSISAQSLRTALRQIYGDVTKKDKLREKMDTLSKQADKTIILLAKLLNGEI